LSFSYDVLWFCAATANTQDNSEVMWLLCLQQDLTTVDCWFAI
jgi:hypothetical protein